MINNRGSGLSQHSWVRLYNRIPHFLAGFADAALSRPFHRDYDAWDRVAQNRYERGRLVAVGIGAMRPIKRVTMAIAAAHSALLADGSIPRVNRVK